MLVQQNKKLKHSSAGITGEKERRSRTQCRAYGIYRLLVSLRWETSVNIPMRAASRSLRRLVVTDARSASVISRSGLARGSKMPPAA